MPDCQSGGALNQAIRDILGAAGARKSSPGVRAALEYIRDVAELDYSAAVKKHFCRPQLREMYGEMRRALPTLNLEVYRITDVDRLRHIAGNLGAALQATTFKSADGTGLRGFYVNKPQPRKRPLIWINTATHPTAVAAAFWHEIGHHLTNKMWITRQNTGNLSLSASGGDHFADPKEIAADMVRSLAGYPRTNAGRLFGDSDSRELNVDRLVSTVIPHMRSAMRFDFQSRFSAKENLYYLGGIIHVAKLRATLLTEYGI